MQRSFQMIATDTSPSAGTAPERAPAERPESTPRLVLQFFLGPLLIVLACAAIYSLFGLVVFEKKTPSDYLREIRTGSASERWQAAFELSRWFASSPEEARDPRFAHDLVALFSESHGPDPRVRRYLALALGRLEDPSAVGPLVEALEDADPETRLYAAWSLGAIGDRAAVAPLLGLLGSEDPGMVKMAAFALGAIGDASAAPALAALLDDASAEIRWNAALALANVGDPGGVPVLLGMTDPEELARVPHITERQKAEAMASALRALHRLGDPRGAERIRALRDAAPYLDVRQVAAALGNSGS